MGGQDEMKSGGLEGARCKVCSSPSRAAVDAALTAGISVRDIAAAHGFSKSLVHSHKAHLATAIATVQQERAAAVHANGKRSAHNILDELWETFEDVWRLRQRVRKQLDEDQSFDPIPLRLLCDAIAQARSTCQVAVNINHLAIEGERLRMAKDAAEGEVAEQLEDLFGEVLGDGRLAGLLITRLEEAGLRPDTAEVLAGRMASKLLADLITAFLDREG